MAVGMIVVRRNGGDSNADQDKQGGDDVIDGLNAVGNQSVRVPHKTGDDLDSRQQEINGHADDDGADGEAVGQRSLIRIAINVEALALGKRWLTCKSCLGIQSVLQFAGIFTMFLQQIPADNPRLFSH